jgi:hypothetical protein
MNKKKYGLEKRIEELLGIIKGYEEGRLTKNQIMEIVKYNTRNENEKGKE